MCAERDERIARLTRMNYSLAQIAVIEGITSRSVQRARQRVGVGRKTSGPPMSDGERALIERLLVDGASYYEVARTVNRSVSTLYKHWPGYQYTVEQAAEVRSFYQQLARI